MVTRRAQRPGFALLDAILGGALLALGLAGVVTLSQRALAMLQRGEREAMAAAMLDDLLGQVVTEGPSDFARNRQVAGRLQPPWPDWEFRVDLEAGGLGDPVDVTATVIDPTGVTYRCATRVAPHDDRLPPEDRRPTEAIDRRLRWEAKEGDPNA